MQPQARSRRAVFLADEAFQMLTKCRRGRGRAD